MPGLFLNMCSSPEVILHNSRQTSWHLRYYAATLCYPYKMATASCLRTTSLSSHSYTGWPKKISHYQIIKKLC